MGYFALSYSRLLIQICRIVFIFEFRVFSERFGLERPGQRRAAEEPKQQLVPTERPSGQSGSGRTGNRLEEAIRGIRRHGANRVRGTVQGRPHQRHHPQVLPRGRVPRREVHRAARPAARIRRSVRDRHQDGHAHVPGVGGAEN